MVRITNAEVEYLTEQLDFRWDCYVQRMGEMTDEERKEWTNVFVGNSLMDANDGEYRVYRTLAEWNCYRGMLEAVQSLGFLWKREDGKHYLYKA